LADFVRAARFERLGVFPYSYEPDTPATRLDGHLAEDVKSERRGRLVEGQQEGALAWREAQVGRTVEEIGGGPDAEGPSHRVARGHADAPDIDCLVRVKGKGLRPGDLVSVKVTAADGYDLVGRSVGAVR